MKIFIRIITFIIFICLLAACNGNDPAAQDRLERMRALHSGRTYEDPEKGFQEVYERDEADRMENIILWNDREDGTLPVSEFYDHIYVENIVWNFLIMVNGTRFPIRPVCILMLAIWFHPEKNIYSFLRLT